MIMRGIWEDHAKFSKRSQLPSAIQGSGGVQKRGMVVSGAQIPLVFAMTKFSSVTRGIRKIFTGEKPPIIIDPPWGIDVIVKIDEGKLRDPYIKLFSKVHGRLLFSGGIKQIEDSPKKNS